MYTWKNSDGFFNYHPTQSGLQLIVFVKRMLDF